jgi:SP family facilitated glucose transporter-like MFS transporter 3
VSALSSVALSLNCVLHSESVILCVCNGLSFLGIVNFFVGLVFLPLRDLLAGGDPEKEGRVFYVFAVVLFASAFVLLRKYRG